MKRNAAVLALPGNARLALAIAAHCGAPYGELAPDHFPDGETRLRLPFAVEGLDLVLAATLDRPDAKMAALHFAAATARELGAKRVLLAAPYLPYMRQDRRFAPGEGTLARQYAAWLGSLVDGLVTVDPHLHRIHALREIFTVPAEIVPAAPDIAAWIAANLEGPLLLIGPDAESAPWVAEVAARLGCPQLHLDKQRLGDAEIRLRTVDLAPHAGRRPVLVDDIVSTAATMLGAARLLREQGFAPPVCIAAHALFAGDAYAELRAVAARVLSCNTVAHESNLIDLHPRIAAAVDGLLHAAPRERPSARRAQPEPVS